MVTVRRLVWNPGNVAHIARRGISLEQVEQACHSPAPAVSETYDGRIRVIAPTNAAKVLTIILAPLGEGAYLPVTARPASRKERALYLERGNIQGE